MVAEDVGPERHEGALWSHRGNRRDAPPRRLPGRRRGRPRACPCRTGWVRGSARQAERTGAPADRFAQTRRERSRSSRAICSSSLCRRSRTRCASSNARTGLRPDATLHSVRSRFRDAERSGPSRRHGSRSRGPDIRDSSRNIRCASLACPSPTDYPSPIRQPERPSTGQNPAERACSCRRLRPGRRR